MTMPLSNVDVHKDFATCTKTGNGTARPECHPDAFGIAKPSRNPHRCACWTYEYLHKLVHQAMPARLDHRAQPPAQNYNPHRVRGAA